MGDLTPRQQFPYPIGPDSPNGPAQILAALTAVERRVVQVFATYGAAAVADADVEPEPGMWRIILTPGGDQPAPAVELRSETEWTHITPGPWETLTPASGPVAMAVQGGSPGYRQSIAGLEFRGSIKRGDGGAFSKGGGADTLLTILPDLSPTVRPSREVVQPVSTSANALTARATVSTAGQISVTATLDYDTFWVDLSNLRYQLG